MSNGRSSVLVCEFTGSKKAPVSVVTAVVVRRDQQNEWYTKPLEVFTPMRLLLLDRDAAWCARCAAPLVEREVVVDRLVEHRRRANRRQFFCPACALDVDVAAMSAALERDGIAFERRAELIERCALRLAAIRARASARARCTYAHRVHLRSITRPATESSDDALPVVPARDPSGRPRVRIYAGGGVFDARSRTGAALRELLRAGAWSSSKREYVFVSQPAGVHVPIDEDPAQPIIGTLYAPFARKNTEVHDEWLLCAWRAWGYRTPVLWLLGLSASEPRDENTLRFREVLHGAGFEGDDAVVLCSPEVNEAALDRLVAVLDEQLDGREQRAPLDPWLAMAERICDDVAAGREERYEPRWLQQRLSSLWTISDPTLSATLGAAASAALERGDRRTAGALLSTSSVRDLSLYLQWIEASVASPDEPDPMRYTAVLVCCALGERAPLQRVLAAAKAAPRSALAAELEAILDSLSDEQDALVIRAWIDAGLPRPLAAMAERALAKIRQRADESDVPQW